MKTYKFILFIFLSLSFVIACNTVEDEENPIVESNQEKGPIEGGTIVATDSTDFRFRVSSAMQQKWVVQDFTLGGSRTFTSCRLDDIMVLNADGSYDYQRGASCGAEDDQASIRNGSWEVEYSTTTKRIIFDKGTINENVAEVIRLEDNLLTVKGVYMNMEIRALFNKD